jgi:hypothetical protein
MKFALFFLFVISAPAQSLHYNINWPSGLALGEAALTIERTPERWGSDLTIDASVPGFTVRDHYHSSANADLCSLQLDKSYTHGRHKSEEKITFDQQNNTATRQSLNGGKSELSLSSCGRDALAFLQFARRELAQGRLVPQQQVVFGALYQVRMEFTGSQTVRVGEEHIEADRIVATIKGPVTDATVEIFFSRDAARTPVLARVPVALGTLTVEIVR